MTPQVTTTTMIDPVQSLNVRVAAYIWDQYDAWHECLSSLSVQLRGVPIYVSVDNVLRARKALALDSIVFVEGIPFSQLLARAGEGGLGGSTLALTAPIVAPPEFLKYALETMFNDARVATLSFLSNDAGMCSFPYRNTATDYAPEGMNERKITQILRQGAMVDACVPLICSSGSTQLVSQDLLTVLGGLDTSFDDRPDLSLIEFSLRASRRGFYNYLDAATYVMKPRELAGRRTDPGFDADCRHRLQVKHKFFAQVFDFEAQSQGGPLAIALDLARAKVIGLKVMIDATCLGPLEMGTQVQTLFLIRALAKHTSVGELTIVVPQQGLPDYARDLLMLPRICVLAAKGRELPVANQVDILHRPFQPDRIIDWDHWRSLGKRILITVQDLIAFKIGAYHDADGGWLSYRENMRVAVRKSDAVISISDDVSSSIFGERLPVASNRVHVVKNGTDHLTTDGPAETPEEIRTRGWIAQQFIVVLGASYSHKNRDIGIRVWKELVNRGYPVKLVLAGATVAQGGTRTEESRAGVHDNDVLVLPDIPGGQRNWLLKHASVLLYPTSAEGFGLVPFEAARFGTPTVYVGFGPLSELIEDPNQARTWSIDALANQAERLLSDDAQRQSNIRQILSSCEQLTWDSVANQLVEVYQRTLAVPPS
jgi:glycosyltransferase involved in cell wall biosynthesis